MKIIRLEAWQLDLVLEEPYSVAYQSYENAPNIFVRLVTNTGSIGLGCAAPDEHVTGETPESVLADLRGPAAEAVTGVDPWWSNLILDRARASGLADRPTALAGLDLALWDLKGRLTGQPVWKLMGGYRDRIRTSVTIGICPVDETLVKARQWLERGYSILKIKGGLDPEADAARLLALRGMVGPSVVLRFDANQGFDLDRTRLFLKLAAGADLEMVEQPTPAGEPEMMGRLKTTPPVPIMADESLLGPGDAIRLAANGWADMVNIKLMKAGGLSGAGRIEAVAASAGMGIMVGCMDEAALGISAGLALALARPGITMADLDGHLDLVDDPTAGAVRVEDGWLLPSEMPGLGLKGDL